MIDLIDFRNFVSFETDFAMFTEASLSDSPYDRVIPDYLELLINYDEILIEVRVSWDGWLNKYNVLLSNSSDQITSESIIKQLNYEK